MRTPGATKALRKALPAERDLEVQDAIIATLGECGDPIAIPLLLEFMDNPVLGIPAAEAIAEIKDPRAAEALKANLNSTNSMRRLAAICGSVLRDISSPADVNFLETQLSSGNTNTVQSVARVLGKAFPRAKQAGLNATRHEDPLVRKGVTDGLSSSEHPEAVPLALRMLLDKDADVRENAWYAAIWISYRSFDGAEENAIVRSLIEATAAQDVDAATFAIQQLQPYLARQDVVAALLKCTDNRDNDIKGAVSSVLYDADALAVNDALLKRVADPSEIIRDAVLRALSEFPVPEAVEPLIAFLESDKADDSARGYAILALGKIGGPRALSFLKSVGPRGHEEEWRCSLASLRDAETIAWCRNQLNAESPDLAITGLGYSRDPAHIPLLTPLLAHKEETTCVVAIDALLRIGTPTAIQAITARMPDMPYYPRWHFSNELNLRRRPELLPLALICLTDKYEGVRFGAICEIDELKGDRTAAIPALRKALKDTSPRVREQAIDILGKIAGPEVIPDLQALRQRGGMASSLITAIEDIRKRARKEDKESQPQ